MATPAPACLAALKQATHRWPNRDTSSDGIMGDARHQATVSDHNLGNAFDLTHDPAHGVDCHVISRQITRDIRTKYVIFNRQIWSRARTTEGWRPYSGDSPHDHHMHVSIYGDDATRRNISPWKGIAVVPTYRVLSTKHMNRDFYPRKWATFMSVSWGVRFLKGRAVDVYGYAGLNSNSDTWSWAKVMVRRDGSGAPVWGYVPTRYLT